MKRPVHSGAIHRLIYYSRNVMAESMTHDAMCAEVEAIAATSRRNNEADRLTGCLMSSASGFAQVLEGPRDALERMFDRICADPRHTDVRLVSLMPVERPSFAGFALALLMYGGLAAADPLRDLFIDPGPDGHRMTTGADVLRLLRSAFDQQRAEADGFDSPLEANVRFS